ncbi:hypothetical protein [uncultured Fibrella sp.]|uniref:hypothetical protein n=1 Tax=uncultured Fibrella sp. TaxID=1284596 RepID=UPI0035CB2F7D
MLVTLLIGLAIGIITAFIILTITLPTKVQYIETVDVLAPVSRVYDAIRYQEQLMEWSAWPSETNSQCSVKGNDGQVGAQTTYFQKEKQFGYQEVTGLIGNELVSFYLTSDAPFEQDTRLHFWLKEVGTDKTRVALWFDNTLKKPSHVLPYVFGIIRWTHQMHLKDLAGLKHYVENTTKANLHRAGVA